MKQQKLRAKSLKSKDLVIYRATRPIKLEIKQKIEEDSKLINQYSMEIIRENHGWFVDYAFDKNTCTTLDQRDMHVCELMSRKMA